MSNKARMTNVEISALCETRIGNMDHDNLLEYASMKMYEDFQQMSDQELEDIANDPRDIGNL
tara:strand:- start:418 stop:603 length:186 start_codon:yes stop_codon:yes gene_type:complete